MRLSSSLLCAAMLKLISCFALLSTFALLSCPSWLVKTSVLKLRLCFIGNSGTKSNIGKKKPFTNTVFLTPFIVKSSSSLTAPNSPKFSCISSFIASFGGIISPFFAPVILILSCAGSSFIM